MKYFFKMENLKKIVFFLLITFPIFEITFFYNSITTLIRVIVILFCFIWLLCISKESRKIIKYLLFYFALLGIYFLCHHFHSLNFSSLVPNNFNYTIMKEFLYFLKLSMPVFLIPLFCYLKFNKEDVKKIIFGWIIMISGSIIVLNLTNLSYGSYSDEPIMGNFFTWFQSNGYNYYDLASKGFFMYANQISTWLLLLVPICFLWIKHTYSKTSIALTLLLLFSCILLGTRVASIGSIVIFILCFFAYLFFVFLHKEEWNKKILFNCFLISLPMILLLPFSPSINRMDVLGSITEEPFNNAVALLVMNGDGYVSLDKTKYIEEHYKEKRIAEQFVLYSYPYEYDPDFWYEILELPVEKRIDYRHLETAIVKRVVEINDNSLDKWLGITNTRIQNIFNIERDFVLQYYAFGIIGSLLFFLPYIYLGYLLIKKWIVNFDLNTSIGLGIYLLYFVCSYASGNNMNHLSTIIPFVFLSSLFAFCIKKDKNSEKGRKNKEEYVIMS